MARERDPLDPIRSAHEGGRVAPGAAYRDPAVYAAEVQRIFQTSWISVACGQNASGPGALFPVRIVGSSLLVARGRDAQVRVFYNLCRHRGALLIDSPCRAETDRIVCPYHAWSYALDGQLAATPHYDRDRGDAPALPADRERLGLIEVRSAVWRDIVFVDLSGNAPPFAEFIRPLDERLAPWTESELRPLSVDEYRLEANWKLAAENFLDAYHLPVVHPELGGGFKDALLTEDVELSDDVLGLVLPQGYGEGSWQAEPTLPRFSGLRQTDRRGIEVFSIFPNTLILVEPDNQQVIVLRPQDPERTDETFANYVVSDAAMRDELAEDRSELYESAILVNDQDAALLANLQRSRSMDVGAETQLAPAWDQTVQRFQRCWAARLLAAR